MSLFYCFENLFYQECNNKIFFQVCIFKENKKYVLVKWVIEQLHRKINEFMNAKILIISQEKKSKNKIKSKNNTSTL